MRDDIWMIPNIYPNIRECWPLICRHPFVVTVYRYGSPLTLWMRLTPPPSSFPLPPPPPPNTHTPWFRPYDLNQSKLKTITSSTYMMHTKTSFRHHTTLEQDSCVHFGIHVDGTNLQLRGFNEPPLPANLIC